jgi:hypothetical protein
VGVGVGVGVLLPGASFSPPTVLCRLRIIASPRRPARALGRREEDFALALFASIRARLVAASRDGGREEVRGPVGVLLFDCRAAKEVELRARAGGFERPDEGGTAEGSSARSHIAVEDCDLVIRSRPVGVFMGGSINVDLRELGVGGVRPMPLPTSVEPVLEPDPSRRPADEAGRRRFMPTAEARLMLRLPFDPLLIPESSTSSHARTSSSAICRTNTAESCSMSQLIRS